MYHRSPGCIPYGAESGGSDWTYWTPFEPWFNGAQQAVALQGQHRGSIFVDNILYTVHGTSIYTVVEGGSVTHLADIAGTDTVFWARNNAQPVPDIVLVAQAGVYVVTSTSVTPYPDVDVGSPNCCGGFDGYIIFGYGNGDMISTDINTTSINSTNIARAESNPDGIVQLVPYNGYLYAMGSATVETWGYPLNETGFPLNRQGYSNTPGLIAQHAVAGSEPEFGKPFIYVASDHTVRQWQSGEPLEISPPQLNRLITEVIDNDFEALVYVSNGVPFWQLSSPTWTWVFNCVNQKWHERISWLQTRSRFVGGSVFAFDSWMTGDNHEDGWMLQLDATVATESGEPLVGMLESLPVEDFPAFVQIPRADFEFTSGVGIVSGHDPDQTNPYVEVSWSNDGGNVWSPPVYRELGRQQKSLNRITVRRAGMSGPQGRRWRLSLPSAVHMGFIGGNMTAYFTDK